MTTVDSSRLSNLFTSISPDSCEEDVENKVIIPLLLLLGYSQEDWQAQAIIGKVRLDYQVHPQNAITPYPPYLVIEAKAPHKKIAYTTWQINRYMRTIGGLLGLLTNGYQFRILYNYHGHIETLAEYSQLELINNDNFKSFYSLLCKKMGLKVSKAFFLSQDRIHQKLVPVLAEKFVNPAMFGLCKKKLTNLDTANTIPGENPVTMPEETTTRFSGNKSMIITVFNNKGGVGKTTLTINLASALSMKGKRVLLIDVDAQANMTTGLGIDPLEDVEYQGRKDITHLLTDPRVKLEDTIVHKKWHESQISLDIIPSHIRLSQMETTLNQTVGIDQVLEKKLRNHNYDFVFIDPPPSFSRVNGISLMASSAVLIPTQLAAYPIRALEYVLERISDVSAMKESKPIQILGIAVSMYDQRSSDFNKTMTQRLFEILEKREASYIPLFPEKTWIPRLNILSLCQDYGYPLYQAEFEDRLKYQEKEAAEKAIERYMELAQHLISITQGES
jgi:cellulose biosynthesis protein BcsQ